MIEKNFVSELIKKACEDEIDRFVVGGVIKKDDTILLLKRPADDFMGGIYELPSGKVEEGEDLIEALKREVKEETGLEVVDVVKYIGHFDYTSKSGKLTRQFNFLINVDEGEIILSEHEDYVWADKEMLKNINVTESVKKILSHVWDE